MNENHTPSPSWTPELENDLAALTGVTDPIRRKQLSQAVLKVQKSFFHSIQERAAPDLQAASIKPEVHELRSAANSAEHLAQFLLDVSAHRLAEIEAEWSYQHDAEDFSFLLSDLARGISVTLTDLEARIKTSSPRRGRRSNQDLRDFVLGLALVYRHFSGKKFTYYRYRSPNGNYEPVTDGHRFVFRAAYSWLGTVIHPNSLAIECERVGSSSEHWFQNTPKNTDG